MYGYNILYIKKIIIYTHYTLLITRVKPTLTLITRLRYIDYSQTGGSFTFTVPEGRKFSKIEINNNGGVIHNDYDDWKKSEDEKSIIWNCTPANSVTL